MFEQDSADAVTLELVADRKRDFCAMRILAADIAADADEALTPTFSQRRGEADVILEIQISQACQIIRRQVAPDSHEAEIDRLRAEPLEMIVQAIAIVGTNRADSHDRAVEHRCVDA